MLQKLTLYKCIWLRLDLRNEVSSQLISLSMEKHSAEIYLLPLPAIMDQPIKTFVDFFVFRKKLSTFCQYNNRRSTMKLVERKETYVETFGVPEEE